jgi:two-component system NtrC family sensor kinase
LLEDRSDDEIGREQSQLHDQLSQIVSQLPEVQSIWVFDRVGHVQVTSTVFPAPAAREYDQEDYIRVHRDGYVGTYIGGHHDSKFGGQQFLPVSRARQNTNGIFQGVVEISILPENFRQFYARLISTGGLQYAIIREDGLILTRYPELSAGNVRFDERSGFARTIVANPSGGFYTTTSQVDQIERRFGIRRLPGYPLFLSAGIATSEMQMEWLTTMGAT